MLEPCAAHFFDGGRAASSTSPSLSIAGATDVSPGASVAPGLERRALLPAMLTAPLEDAAVAAFLVAFSFSMSIMLLAKPIASTPVPWYRGSLVRCLPIAVASCCVCKGGWGEG